MRTITASRAETLAIGALSKRSGVNIETIRYYERVKMLAPPPRTASGRRVYDRTGLRSLVFIRRARELGFSLDEIRALLQLPAAPSRRRAAGGAFFSVAHTWMALPITSAGRRSPFGPWGITGLFLAGLG
jgi:MerR family mercuric resistance operon transcriptional regulator